MYYVKYWIKEQDINGNEDGYWSCEKAYNTERRARQYAGTISIDGYAIIQAGRKRDTTIALYHNGEVTSSI